MNSNINTSKSTEELKNQVVNDINKVRQDFDEIKSRLTPGQMIDDAIFYRHGGDRAATFNHLKSNPVGTAFLTIGTLLLMEDENHLSYEANARKRGVDALSEAKVRVAVARDTLESKVHGLETKMHGLESKMLNQSDRLNGVASNLKGKARDAIETAKNIDPLAYMALGAGLGTLTGASVPMNEREAQMVDSVFEDKVLRFSQDLQSALNESVNIMKKELIGGLADINLNFF